MRHACFCLSAQESRSRIKVISWFENICFFAGFHFIMLLRPFMMQNRNVCIPYVIWKIDRDFNILYNNS
ncbi:MAG TPA: hypothetical protein DCF42_07260 [Lachnospiraceae bacterium]|nr:hypothetical protein [Lachnospiraceae bacterium]